MGSFGARLEPGQGVLESVRFFTNSYDPAPLRMYPGNNISDTGFRSQIDRQLGGVFGGVRFETNSALYVYLLYEWQAIETPVETGLVRSNAHFLTLGLGGAP